MIECTMPLELTGKRFGRLTVLRRSDTQRGGDIGVDWLCQCDCGRTAVVSAGHLGQGRKYCGYGCHSTKHKACGTKEHDAWTSIKDRCFNPNNKSYHRYGGRGISMDPTWRASFRVFLDAVGHAPSTRHSIDRIDNDRGYEPGNCRWATTFEQVVNRCNTTHVVYQGKETPFPVAMKESGTPMSPTGIKARMRRGLSFDEAVALPSRNGAAC